MSRNTMTAHDKLCAAISIVQHHILAEDSAINAKAFFGHEFMRTAALELAVDLMRDCLGPVEQGDD